MTRPPSAAIRSAEDLLAYIPHGLGHWPRESLVVLADSGGAAGGLLRLDLPPRCTASAGAEIGRYVQAVLAPGAPSGVFVIVYTADRPRAGAGLPVLVHRLVRTLERLGLTVRDCLYVGDEGWGHIDAAQPDAPWSRRRSLDAVSASVLNTELVFAGRAWGPAPESVIVPTPTGPDAEEVRRWAGVHDPGSHPDPPDPAWARRVAAAWDRALSAAAPDPVAGLPVRPDIAGLLLAGLRSRTIRDLVLFQSAVGPSAVISELILSADSGGAPAHPSSGDPALNHSTVRTAAARTTTARTGTRTPAEQCPREPPDRDARLRAGGVPLLASVITGSVALGPDWQRLDAAYRLLEALAPHADGQVRCATLTLLGWIEFARGRGSRAHHFLDAALRVDSRYELARLFDRFLDLGQVHEWARHRATAWKGDSPDTA
ncbi:hypothetical protein BKD30_02435 [Tersicoccus phoenicis]|uniref:DUF4192 domain-containing protein n=1 Tax=Tersicoccus phoenicis TaxID=554083 RepID=A0A1R1LJV2_9MICC|nr:DUF4192 family protein [Tersicoccus phoenicis]OMH27815.1 hypothetical protein BKD30_02435 [Tersicoccus phoenicis]